MRAIEKFVIAIFVLLATIGIDICAQNTDAFIGRSKQLPNADNSDAVSIYERGCDLLYGNRQTKNVREGLKCLKQSANMKYPPALYQLGYYYQYRTKDGYFDRDLDAACKYYKKAADLDYKPAKIAFNFLMSTCFQSKENTTTTKCNIEATDDISEFFGIYDKNAGADARECLLKYNALQNTEYASFYQLKIAYQFHNGNGVQKSDAVACYFYRKIIDLDSITDATKYAYTNLGSIYLNYRGSIKDHEIDNNRNLKAGRASFYNWAKERKYVHPYYKHAAELGSTFAECWLGYRLYRFAWEFSHEKGLSEEKKQKLLFQKEGLNYLRHVQIAAAQGDSEAIRNLNDLFADSQGERYLGMPADSILRYAHDCHALNTLGDYYSFGYGDVNVDVEKAIHFYMLAADKGSKHAFQRLRDIYSEDFDLPRPVRSQLKQKIRVYKKNKSLYSKEDDFIWYFIAVVFLGACVMLAWKISEMFKVAAKSGNGKAKGCAVIFAIIVGLLLLPFLVTVLSKIIHL